MERNSGGLDLGNKQYPKVCTVRARIKQHPLSLENLCINNGLAIFFLIPTHDNLNRWRSPPSRPKWTVDPPYKACCTRQQVITCITKFVDDQSISPTQGATQICVLCVHIPNSGGHSICGLFGVDMGCGKAKSKLGVEGRIVNTKVAHRANILPFVASVSCYLVRQYASFLLSFYTRQGMSGKLFWRHWWHNGE